MDDDGKRRKKSLARSFSRGIFLLLLFFTLVQGVVFYFIWQYFSAQQKQRSEWTFSEQVASRLEPYYSPQVDFSSLRRASDEILEANLDKDIHFLNARGEILMSFCRCGVDPLTQTIPLSPVLKFLEDSGRRSAPLYGLNPYTMRQDALFSATEINFGSDRGYVYVVLSNRHADRVQTRYQGQASILSIILSSLAALLGTSILGSIMFGPLTRRISGLMSTVRTIGQGDRTARAPTVGDDELSELGGAVNRMAQEIESAVAKLERKDVLRRELVENIWHDIRGPVAGLRGLAEVMEKSSEDQSPDLLLKLAGGISANAAHLSRFLDELRDVSDLDMQERVPASEAIDIVDLAEDLCAGLVHRASESGIELRVETEGSVPIILGDANLLSRLLQNLIENALRYTERNGKIIVGFKEKNDKVELSVKDSGIGIAESDLPHLFDRKYQGEEGIAKSPDSRGLGLSIVQKIAEAHGSKVSVESSKAHGTRFSILLRKYTQAKA